MSRDVKVGLDYFPIYHDFFVSKKIKALRRAHGTIGIATYLNILCRVYDNGYYYKFDNIKDLAMDIAEDIANEQLRKVATCVTKSIHYLVEQQILAEEFFKQDVITGVAMQEQYVKSAYKAKRKIKMGSYLLIDVHKTIEKIKKDSEKIGFSSEQKGISFEEMQQSKSKSESESKSEISLSTTTTTTLGPPRDMEILEYFEKHCRISDAGREAYLFKIYNANRRWDCLPDWQAAANLWIARIGTKGG